MATRPELRFKRRFSTWCCAGTWLLITAVAAQARVTLRAVFNNDMVLQREASVPISGTAEPGEQVRVQFAGQNKTATADAQGKWLVNWTR